MNNEKILLVVLVVFSLSLFLTNTSRGLQTEDIETETEIEMVIENDGTYELKSNISLENISLRMIMVENLDLQTDIENIEGDKISVNPNSKIKFDNTIVETNSGKIPLGLFLLNDTLKEAIPGKPSNLIPDQYKSIIESVLNIDIERLDKEPILLLNLPNQSLALGQINSILSNRLEGESIDNLIDEYNLEGNIPPGARSYIPNAKIEKIRITSYNWNSPILNIAFNIELSEGTEDIQKFKEALPLKINLSYLSSYSPSPEAETDIKIDSEAPLPGYKEKGTWSIKPPSEVNQMLEDIGIWEREGGVNFKLKTPETAEVHNLPEDYEKTDDSTYQWSGEEGKKAIRSIMENESLKIELEEEPAGGVSSQNPLLWAGIFATIVIIALIAIITIRK